MMSLSNSPYNPTTMNNTTTTVSGSITVESLEMAGRTVEKMLHADSLFPPLAEKLRVGGLPTISGLQEPDYPTSTAISVTGDLTNSLRKMNSVKRVPLPTELVEHFGHMQCNCMMGLFPQIERAWLTIDSDIYVWRFEDTTDLAYFDGLSDTILSVALLEPRKNIFQPNIKYLLCLTTAVEIVLLGVGFGTVDDDNIGGMHLLQEPLFTLPADSTFMISIAGSSKTGRIFLGGKDGSLYEFAYKTDNGWFGKKASKINHSTSTLSFLVPNFINAALYEEDAILQIVVDDSRNILFLRSEKGTIQMFDLGSDGLQMTKVVSLTQQTIVEEASRIAINVDKSNFSPIIGISCIPMSDSVHLNLLAVSANGVRYFFSSSYASYNANDGSVNRDGNRPQNLTLQHVRLPPGFSATSPMPKPNNVHMSYYKQGTLLLTSSQSDDNDLLWLLSSDSFAFHNILMENQSTIPLDGRIWALDEIPQSEKMIRLYKDSFSSQHPPLAVIQHSQASRKFVLISSQGTHIVSKLRPVDQLRQILIENSGPDNEVVRAYFGLHSEVQAAATCLILACSNSIQDAEVAQWATRAFFLYGGDPQLLFPQQQQQQQQQQHHQQQHVRLNSGFPATQTVQSPSFSSPAFHPHLASTPGPNPNMSMSSFSPQWGQSTPGVQSMMGAPVVPEMHFSTKHNALFLYYARLIRPVWLATLVVPGNKDAPMNSTVSGEEIEWILMQLTDFCKFLEKNSIFNSSTNLANFDSGAATTSSISNMQHKTHQEALLRERQSLLFLQHLVTYSMQVMGLWKVVNDHQFEVVAASLPLEDQNLLRGMYFRDLMISVTGRDLCNRLVQSVIQRYLNDNASTDAISNRLRDVCPALYHDEDAISSKAHEMLINARNEMNPRERERLLKESVSMCKDIAGRINLEVLTSHLTAVHCYTGAVELCLAAAAKRDPQGLALHYYNNGEPVEDQQGLQAFVNRMSCYKHVLEILTKLLDTSQAHPMSTNVPKTPGPPPVPDPNVLPPSEAGDYAQKVLQVMLSCDDNLAHVALYQWHIDQGQFERLLSFRTQYVEDFLTRGTKKNSDSVIMFDLLWKFYEKTRSYAAAAKILSKLADRKSKDINLSNRLEYLSRAIMCVKSGELGGESSRVQVGELLHELEEKMEVARVQLQIVEALSSLQNTRNGVPQALARLNNELLDISKLYQNYAEPFDLWECQLAILHCAGHFDPPLVESMWSNIIDEELKKTESLNSTSRIAVLSNKISELGKIYAGSQKYFPIEFIVKKLEVISCQFKENHSWVFKTFLGVGVGLPKILEIYNRLYMLNDPVWLSKGSQNHLLYVLAKVLETFADSPSTVNYNERRQFTVMCLDAVGQYLGNLYTKHDSQLLVQEFRGIQAKLERL